MPKPTRKDITQAERDLFEARLERIHKALGTRTQVQLAEKLGVRQSSISDARRRASIPDGWLLKLALEYKLNPARIMYGDQGGAPYLVASDADGGVVNAEALRAEITAQVRDEIDNLGVAALLARLKAALPGQSVLVVPPGSEANVRPVSPPDEADRTLGGLALPPGCFSQPIPDNERGRYAAMD